MDRVVKCAATAIVLVIASSPSFAQQASSGMHKYLYRAVLTTEGVKDLKTRTTVALRNNIIKFVESVGCRHDFWYFDYLNTTAYGGVDCPDESAIATIMLTVNAAPYARLTYWSCSQLSRWIKQSPRPPIRARPNNNSGHRFLINTPQI
jgi:hypothetical protein